MRAKIPQIQEPGFIYENNTKKKKKKRNLFDIFFQLCYYGCIQVYPRVLLPFVNEKFGDVCLR